MKGFIVNMFELIVVLNIAASRKNNFILLELYYTKEIKINKAGIYKGGSITRATFPSDLTLCNNVDISHVNLLLNKYCFQVGPNSFFIDADQFQFFFEMLANKSILFIDTQNNALLVASDVLNQKKEVRPYKQFNVGIFIFLYFRDNTLYIEKTKKIPQYEVMEPKPQLHYNEQEQTYILQFAYQSELVPCSDKRGSFQIDNKIYLRNYNYESAIVEILRKKHFVKLSQGRFAYSGMLKNVELYQNLAEFHIDLDWGYDEMTTMVDVNVSLADTEWFEIDLTCNISGKITQLASIIDLTSMKHEYTIDGNKIVLPSPIVQAAEHLVLDKNKLKINRKYFFDILRIAATNEINLKKIFNSNQIILKLPENLKQMSYSYQLEGILWLKKLFLNKFGGCLTDDMGLGKTFQIISFLEDKDVRKKIKKVLIVVPKSLVTNWKKEFDKFSTTHAVGIYHGSKRCQNDIDSADIIITTYNTACIDINFLKNMNFSLVVFDEIQMTKNHNSLTSHAMKMIMADVKIGLSGTPMENNISELWNILDILNPQLLPSHSIFLKKYKNQNHAELKTVLSPFILRRMKKDVLSELPQKNEHIIYCDMEIEQRQLYASICLSVKNAILSLKAFSAPVILKGLTLLRQCCCHPLLLKDTVNIDKISTSCKLDNLKIIVKNLHKNNHKILIFSNYTSMLNLIKKNLELEDEFFDSIYYLDGKTTDRNKIVEKFEKASNGIFLISIKAGGVGLNLISAQDVIIYDPWWNPFVEMQAIDRAYRIGQTKHVNVYKLVAADTIEEKILSMQNNKLKDFEEILNNIVSNLDIETILTLL